MAAVVFDWYGTLAAPNPDDFWSRLAELIADAGGRPDADALRTWEHEHPLAHGEHSSDEHAYRRWQRARLEALFTACALDATATVTLLERIEEERYSRLFDVFPEVPSVLRSLRDRGVTLGVCSNWDWDLERHLSHNGIDGAFDFVLTSAAVGFRKPHPAIFERACAEAGAQPDQVLFVGDTWTDDVEGATAAGLVPVHIARNGGCRRADDHGVVPCVADLSGVTALLEG